MLVLTICGLISLLFSLPFFNKKNLYGLRIAFFLPIIISVIRYDYGNDYWSYYNMYNSILYSNLTLVDFFDFNRNRELGFSILCYFFKPFGFNFLIACLSIFVNICYYKFIKTYVPVKYYTLAVFLYLFEWSIFPIQLSMIRQSIAICIFMISFNYIIKKEVLKALIIILIAIFFHQSAIILIPFIFLGYITDKWIDKVCLIIIFLLIILLINSSYINSIFNYFILFDFFEKYTYVDKYSNSQIGLRAIIHTFPSFLTFLILLNNKTNITKTNKLILLIPCLSVIFLPFNQVSVIIGRLAFYFNTFTIAAYPQIWMNCKYLVIKFLLAFLILIIMLYEYVYFFMYSDIYKHYFYNFHTIFD